MQAVQGLFNKIDELDREIVAATKLRKDLDDQQTADSDALSSAVEKQDFARNSIHRNDDWFTTSQVELCEVLASNDVLRVQIRLAHQEIHRFLELILDSLHQFDDWSKTINTSLQGMLAELNDHDFYIARSLRPDDLQRLRSNWKETVVTSELYWKDEEDELHCALLTELSKCSALRLRSTPAAMTDRSVKENFSQAEEPSVIDLADARCAIIDLDSRVVSSSTESMSCVYLVPAASNRPIPWYQQVKRRRTDQHHTVSMNDLGFVSGWAMLNNELSADNNNI